MKKENLKDSKKVNIKTKVNKLHKISKIKKNKVIIKNYGKLALKAHEKFGGKISLISKMQIKTKDDLSIAYTPGVADVCREIHKGKMEDLQNKKNISDDKKGREFIQAKKYTLKRNTIAVVTDGSAVLGLGNIGASASIPVMEGKAAIMKNFANVDAFPVCIETQDVEEIIKIIKNISSTFGGINLEDISAPKCFEIEERLVKELNIPVMHDDQWGAATVTLAGLINALKIVKKDLNNCTVVVVGVGAAGVATIKLLKSYAKNVKILAIDSVGIISKNRKDIKETKNKMKLDLLNDEIIFGEMEGDLQNAILKSDVFIGLSKPDLLSVEMVKSMSMNPIVFALANPSPEIMPEDAYRGGAAIVGTGRSDFPNQINNSVFFPGFWRGMLDRKDYSKIYDLKMLTKVAETIAKLTKKPSKMQILPNTLDKKVHVEVAKIVRNYKV
jgi:malate dehydrogenase (oxaloacetate-decarboxylating)